MALEQQKTGNQTEWILNADQISFMLQHHNAIEAAYADDDMEFLRQLATSEAFVVAFGSMGWDEAYDRYEAMIESRDGDA